MSVSATGLRSSELSQSSGTFIPEDAKIRCLRDHIIVEPLPIEHSQMLQVFEYGKPVRGIVRAVGPGHYPKRYDHPDKHRRTKMWEGSAFLPTQVRAGDVVELGSPQGMRGYSFQHISWGGKTHLICREADVACIVEGE